LGAANVAAGKIPGDVDKHDGHFIHEGFRFHKGFDHGPVVGPLFEIFQVGLADSFTGAASWLDAGVGTFSAKEIEHDRQL